VQTKRTRYDDEDVHQLIDRNNPNMSIGNCVSASSHACDIKIARTEASDNDDNDDDDEAWLGDLAQQIKTA
jgi:hypothetical protein